LFAAGYFVVWSGVGALAFGAAAIAGDVLAGDAAGRLRKCRSPLGFLLGAWREGRAGALRMGAKHGAWCVGCCWALMASLFALGVMSIAWMAFVAALIAAEKMLPWRRVATYGTATILLALGVLLLVSPDAIPALTIPDGDSLSPMGS
jgi:predicted metal-binding membrane protein